MRQPIIYYEEVSKFRGFSAKSYRFIGFYAFHMGCTSALERMQWSLSGAFTHIEIRERGNRDAKLGSVAKFDFSRKIEFLVSTDSMT